MLCVKSVCFSQLKVGTLCAHDQDGTTSTTFWEKKTLFAGLYIIWIISQKQQQQQLCLILLHRTEK